MNKKILLLVLVLCLSMIFVGCGKNIPKAPDNFDKDLWEDSVKVIRVIYSTYDADNNFSVEDEKLIKEYLDVYKNRLYDNNEEYILIKNINQLYKNYNSYIFSKSTFSNEKLVNASREEVDKILDELENDYNGLIK